MRPNAAVISASGLERVQKVLFCKYQLRVYTVGHETELLSQRSHGRSVAAGCALGSRAQVWRSAGQIHAREMVNAILYLVRNGCMRSPPHDLPPYRIVFHYFRLWQQDGTWEHLHAKLRERVDRRGQLAQALGCHSRQPERQDHRARRATRLRCGEKKSSAANGIRSLIPSGCSGRWSSLRRMCKIAMAVGWPWRRSAATSSGRGLSGPTEPTRRPPPGLGFAGLDDSNHPASGRPIQNPTETVDRRKDLWLVEPLPSIIQRLRTHHRQQRSIYLHHHDPSHGQAIDLNPPFWTCSESSTLTGLEADRMSHCLRNSSTRACCISLPAPPSSTPITRPCMSKTPPPEAPPMVFGNPEVQNWQYHSSLLGKVCVGLIICVSRTHGTRPGCARG